MTVRRPPGPGARRAVVPPGVNTQPHVPSVTVVLPTRNRPREVRRAVRSVLGQTHEDWRLIVVDDGSALPVTPGMLGVTDTRITVMRNDPARGVALARNAAIARADTPWVAFLDDDDLWAPDKLARQLADAEATQAEFLYSSATYVTPAGAWVYDRIVPPAEGLTAQLLAENVVGEPSTVLVARDALRRAEGFDPVFSMLADWDLWLRLSRTARPHATAEITTAILMHPGSMQLVERADASAELDRLAAKHRGLTDELGRGFGSPEIDLWLAEKHRRADPSVGTTLRYLRSMVAMHGRRDTAGRVVRRAYRTARPVAAPAWVRDLLAG